MSSVFHRREGVLQFVIHWPCTTDNQQLVVNHDPAPNTMATGDNSGPPNKVQRIDTNNPVLPVISYSYWPGSPEAYFLVKPRTRSGETPQEAVERRIKLLKPVHECEDSWRNVVVGRDAHNFCTKVEIVEI